MAQGDPLSLFLSALERQRQATDGRLFEAGEHVWLGNQGLLEACRDLGLDPAPYHRIRRLRAKDELSYGELVALSGDFYGSPEDLFEEKPSPVPWLWEDNDLSDLREVFRAELGWIEDERRGPSVRYPDNNIALAWNAKSYLELATANDVHFGWHNLLEYVRRHAAALDLALTARAAGDPKRRDELWRRALYTNAFADHFLTDGFAAGHIRVPRSEIREWARVRQLEDSLAGALSKLLHDQDGHVNTLHGAGDRGLPDDEGLRVVNALGDEWFTRCDGQLFIVSDRTTAPAIRQPVLALKASIAELFRAFRDGERPTGVFAAARRVPFPHPGAPSLVEKFPADPGAGRLEALFDSTRWYLKIPWIGPGLERDHIRALFGELPALLARLRDRVAREAGLWPEVVARLPAEYVGAFRRVA